MYFFKGWEVKNQTQRSKINVYALSKWQNKRYVMPHLLNILQSARVWFQGGRVLHHFVHCDHQEDEIELSKQSNGSINS